MRAWRILAFVIPVVGFLGVRLHQNRASQEAAKAMIERSFAPPWSTNEQVVSSMEDKLKREPGNAKANAALGQAYLQRARESGDPAYYTKAEILFERALKGDARSVDAILGKASLLMARHEFLEARDLARKAIDWNPDVVAPYGVLADALVELGNYDDALQTLEVMMSKKPNLASYSRVSYFRELHGDMEGAIQAMRMAIDAGAPHAENTAWCMVQLGNLYRNIGRLEEAANQYQSALFRFPGYAHALAGLARTAEARRDLSQATRYYTEAAAQIPLPEFAIGLADIYERMGKTEEAKAQVDLVDAIQQLYQTNGVSMDLDLALFNADRGRDIEKSLAVAQSEWKRRKSVRVADAYAWTLYRSGRFEEAEQMMRQALRLGSRDPLFLQHAEAISRASQSAGHARHAG